MQKANVALIASGVLVLLVPKDFAQGSRTQVGAKKDEGAAAAPEVRTFGILMVDR